jgi:hypothetical protein
VVSIAVVAAMVLTFSAGYAVGRSDLRTVPDLHQLDRARGEAPAAELRDVPQTIAALEQLDLRLGRVSLRVCGDRETRGMVVWQSPPPGATVPVGEAVGVWVAIPAEDTPVSSTFTGLERPCR